jgi:hypothetical protein
MHNSVLKLFFLQGKRNNHQVTDFIKKFHHCLQKWHEGIASLQWAKCLMKHHPHLSLRKPENTSLARATSFNQKNITHFQNNYKELLVKFQFTAMQIYNLDETDVTTVVQAPHIVAQIGVKQFGHMAYAEKCQMAPVCTTTARRNVVPPVLFSLMLECVIP